MAALEAYLDIETTGLSYTYDQVTVVGVAVGVDGQYRVTQLYDDALSREALLDGLRGVGRLYTYNGSRFDLPFLDACLGLPLERLVPHHDLMYDCWRHGLRGGLKTVERHLGIPRAVEGVDGAEAVRLWWRYQREGDRDALRTLLHYNREDVLNLTVLRARLLGPHGGRLAGEGHHATG